MTKPIAININFDSLNENFGFPKNYHDPSFFEIFDRFLEFSNEYNFKYSIYIIGKDLENKELADRVKDWQKQGHEIGNHSYTHHLNLGNLPIQKVREEIQKSHELISNCTGTEPKGFICPGWSTSKKVLEILIEQNYLYDTSLFPSALLYPAVVKNALNHIKHPKKFKEILSRKDYLFPLNKPLQPFFADKNYNIFSQKSEENILVLPLPTLNRFSYSLWHTLLFMFSRKKGNNMINRYLRECDFFYYLMHPADLTDYKDLPKDKKHTIERMNYTLQQKTELVKNSFELFKESKRPILTMKEIATLKINEGLELS